MTDQTGDTDVASIATSVDSDAGSPASAEAGTTSPAEGGKTQESEQTAAGDNGAGPAVESVDGTDGTGTPAPKERVFVYNGQELPDPDTHMSVADVRRHYSEYFAELANCETSEQEKDGKVVISFSKRIGVKGASDAATVLSAIRSTPVKKLRVFALAEELLTDDGELRIDLARSHEPNIRLAILEAQVMAKETQQAVTAIRALPAR